MSPLIIRRDKNKTKQKGCSGITKSPKAKKTITKVCTLKLSQSIRYEWRPQLEAQKNSQKPCNINIVRNERVRNTHTYRENTGGKKRHFFRKDVKNLSKCTKKLKEFINIPRCC